jgi:hypothetical protein
LTRRLVFDLLSELFMGTASNVADAAMTALLKR